MNASHLGVVLALGKVRRRRRDVGQPDITRDPLVRVPPARSEMEPLTDKLARAPDRSLELSLPTASASSSRRRRTSRGVSGEVNGRARRDRTEPEQHPRQRVFEPLDEPTTVRQDSLELLLERERQDRDERHGDEFDDDLFRPNLVSERSVWV